MEERENRSGEGMRQKEGVDRWREERENRSRDGKEGGQRAESGMD